MTDMAATLCQAWRNKANDLMRISKAYKCRSMETMRTAYIKQAAQLRMCADDLENANAREAQAAEAKAASHQPVQGQGPSTPGLRTGTRRPPMAQNGQLNPDAGQVDVPAVQENDAAWGSGSSHPALAGRNG